MQIGPRIRFDSHTLGNLVKNISPAAGLLGGPAGIALAGGLSAVGDKLRGKDVSLANALTNASLAGGVGGLKSALTSHGAPAASVLNSAATDTVPAGGLALPATPNLTTAATRAVDPRNIVSKALDTGKGLAGWASDHPLAASGALNAVGDLATSGAKNRATNAQATLLEQQAGETAYDFERRKMRDQQLAPVWSSLGSSIGNSYGGVAQNPYLPG